MRISDVSSDVCSSGLIFLMAGLPICYYGARYGVDMDLLTRGAGFGYLGSTITSAVSASFTFILFAIEAVTLSAALQLSSGISRPIGHIISAPVSSSEERRTGQEGVSTCRPRRPPQPQQKK